MAAAGNLGDTRRVRGLFVLILCFACGGDGKVGDPDAGTSDATSGCAGATNCNPLMQTGCSAGEKCTWIIDAVMPQYIGHVGCARIGSADVGDACTFGSAGCDGYDNCKQGLVCGNFYGGAGTCKRICDQQGGFPQCDNQHSCVTYQDLFSTGDTTPPVAGACDRACDPLADNDFDGAGSATKLGTTCGTDPLIGCYGYPSFGTAPRTEWSCLPDINAGKSLRHRATCTTATGCSPSILNSCNQGYLPLLKQSSTISTTVCAALCKPKNCYAGNCGANDDNRLGEAPHRCNTTDRVGTFDTSPGGEHCAFMWWFERDEQGSFLRSPSSDTVGVCYDRSKYGQPACATLTLQQASQQGCVDSGTAGL
jgi:hypothetical protein